MTAERIWDAYLSPSDREWARRRPHRSLDLGRRSALLLIDLYRGGFGDRPEPLEQSVQAWPWSCGMNGWRALPHIQNLLAAAREKGMPVIHSTMRDPGDGLLGWLDVLHRGEAGALVSQGGDEDLQRRSMKIVDEAAPLAGEAIVEKAAPSAFWGTPLIGHLRQLDVDALLVAGMATSGCVRATVVDGAANRLRMLVVEECVFDRLDSSHAISLFDIHHKYGEVISLNEALKRMETAFAAGW